MSGLQSFRILTKTIRLLVPARFAMSESQLGFALLTICSYKTRAFILDLKENMQIIAL